MSKSKRKSILRPPKSTKAKKGISMYLILWIVFISFIIYRVIHLEIQFNNLATEGIVTRGYIYSYIVSGHGGSNHYRFDYPDNRYPRYGSDYGDCYWKVPGDSIDIIFLPDNPEINRPWDFIKRRKKAQERIQKGELPK